jgi:hypothetical protein
MDARGFERIARALRAPDTRRSAIRVLAGLAVGTVGLAVEHGLEAKQTSCKPCRRKKKGTCKGKQPDGTPCGAGKTCQAGSCGCRRGTELCGG